MVPWWGRPCSFLNYDRPRTLITVPEWSHDGAGRVASWTTTGQGPWSQSPSGPMMGPACSFLNYDCPIFTHHTGLSDINMALRLLLVVVVCHLGRWGVNIYGRCETSAPPTNPAWGWGGGLCGCVGHWHTRSKLQAQVSSSPSTASQCLTQGGNEQLCLESGSTPASIKRRTAYRAAIWWRIDAPTELNIIKTYSVQWRRHAHSPIAEVIFRCRFRLKW